MRRPNSERNSAPSAFTGPRVSKAMETNTWVAGNNAYLAVLRTAACSAAEPAEIAVCHKYDAAQLWTTVASQAMYLPADQGMSVAPSIFKIPFYFLFSKYLLCCMSLYHMGLHLNDEVHSIGVLLFCLCSRPKCALILVLHASSVI